MNARTLKRAIYGSALVAAGLTTTWIVTRAVNAQTNPQLQTVRDATIAALQDAIARGDDGIGPLPVNYIEDVSDMQEDDALMRGLWLRLNNGPASQQGVVNLLQETAAQQQRESNRATSMRRLADE